MKVVKGKLQSVSVVRDHPYITSALEWVAGTKKVIFTDVQYIFMLTLGVGPKKFKNMLT